ncbi:MAG: hypothetical protein MUC49_10550 [Raineya sp.]|jgi:hypothetical protein|nr:hypothetical protein [Raineya sp.]
MKKIIISTLVTTMLFGCTDPKGKTDGENKQTEVKQETEKKDFKVNFEDLNSMPNPIEMVDLIKSTGVEYDNTILNKPANTEKYNAEHKMALNVGVYSVDLGYANLHNKAQDAINYLDATKKMTDGLKVSQHFNFEEIKKIIQENNDLNKLLAVTLEGLEKMKQGLEDEKRSESVTLVVIGGWIESIYIAAQVAEKTEKQELKDKIADQKAVITLLIKMIEPNKSSSKHIEELYADLKKIEDAYKNISVDAKTTKEDFAKLNQTIKDVRNKVVS